MTKRIYIFLFLILVCAGCGPSENATTSPTINPTTATFDKHPDHQADLVVTMTRNGNTLQAISDASGELAAGSDYDVSDETVTIQKSYLAHQAVGTLELSFDFDEGKDPVLTVTVSDSTDADDDGGGDDLPDECPGQCNAATPVYPTPLSDGGLGNVTMYSTSASDGGACNYGTTDVMNYAAINVNVLPDDAQGQWQAGKICGQCAEVTALTSQGPQTVVVRIMDKCPDEHCGIDLGGDAPATIMLDGSGRYEGKWHFVSCDGHPEVSDGPPVLYVLPGSNSWWSRVHVRNGSTATDSIAWQDVADTANGYLSYATNPENAFEVPVDDVLQSGISSVLITVHYVDGTTATVTLTPAELAAESTAYPLVRSDSDPTPTPDPEPDPEPDHHVDNPFAGANGYINPDYTAKVAAEAQRTGGSLGEAMAEVAQYSTAVWLDRMAAIEGSADLMGLRAHLDQALQQQDGDSPLTIMVVIYDLPNRDCAAAASNGELLIAEDGLNIYKTQYIDPIAEILSDAKYSSLRIVAVVEPDSLPNLVTNLDVAACAEANSSGAYVDGIRYAIDRLHPIGNVYLYLDIAHSGWLGWDSNFSPAVQLYRNMLQKTTDGVNSIDGFITNTANYTPVEEVYLPNADLNVGGQPIKASEFYEWNPYFDEKDFATALRSAFVNAGLPSSIGMLIDTSRSGWGGSQRPDGVSGSSDLNTYVDESCVDRRPHRGGWCNQQGAGIGVRPQVTPAAGIDAYVWVKPPGESDGVSSDTIVDPDDPNKKFDTMCDPNGRSSYNSNYPTNAMPDAPHAGRWFSEQFQMLVENAYPPLLESD
jgi:cellulase/cellobiase CelA1